MKYKEFFTGESQDSVSRGMAQDVDSVKYLWQNGRLSIFLGSSSHRQPRPDTMVSSQVSHFQ